MLKKQFFEGYCRYIFLCECTEMSHTLFVDVFNDGDYAQFDIGYLLSQYLPWYKRILVAIKYIFNITNEKQHFSAILLGTKNVEELRSVCDDFLAIANSGTIQTKQ